MNSNFISRIAGILSIKCPVCGCEETHHDEIVSIFRFSEDCELGTNVSVKGSNVSFSSDAETKNPSRRRDAASIKMYCEQGHRFAINFIQHKGTTFIECEVEDA